MKTLWMSTAVTIATIGNFSVVSAQSPMTEQNYEIPTMLEYHDGYSISSVKNNNNYCRGVRPSEMPQLKPTECSLWSYGDTAFALVDHFKCYHGDDDKYYEFKLFDKNYDFGKRRNIQVKINGEPLNATASYLKTEWTSGSLLTVELPYRPMNLFTGKTLNVSVKLHEGAEERLYDLKMPSKDSEAGKAFDLCTQQLDSDYWMKSDNRPNLLLMEAQQIRNTRFKQ